MCVCLLYCIVLCIYAFVRVFVCVIKSTYSKRKRKHTSISPKTNSSCLKLLSFIAIFKVYMARVAPTIDAVNDRNQWEFFAGKDSQTGKDVWARGNVSQAAPLFTWNTRTGVVTMTFVPALSKYIMCITTPTETPYTVKDFDTYLLESDNLTGPFRLVVYMAQFGPEGYFVHLPSKFLSASTTTAKSENGKDAVTFFDAYLSYSANFAESQAAPDPVGSGYHWSLQPIRFTLSD